MSGLFLEYGIQKRSGPHFLCGGLLIFITHFLVFLSASSEASEGKLQTLHVRNTIFSYPLSIPLVMSLDSAQKLWIFWGFFFFWRSTWSKAKLCLVSHRRWLDEVGAEMKTDRDWIMLFAVVASWVHACTVPACTTFVSLYTHSGLWRGPAFIGILFFFNRISNFSFM